VVFGNNTAWRSLSFDISKKSTLRLLVHFFIASPGHFAYFVYKQMFTMLNPYEKEVYYGEADVIQ